MNTKKNYTATTLLLTCIFIANLHAQPFRDTLHISQPGLYPLYKHLYVGKITSNENPSYIIDSVKPQDFLRIYPEKAFNAGVTNRYYWLVFTVTNNLSENAALFFELNNPGINIARAYQRKNNHIQMIGEAGDHLAFGTRRVKYYDAVFPFQLGKNETADIFIMLDNTGDNLDCMPQLYDSSIFNAKERRYYSVISMITGIMLTALLLNIFLAVSLRDKLHLIYSLYIISILFEMYILQGIDIQFIYPNNPLLSDVFKYLSPALTLTLMAYVMQLFLNQKRTNSRLRIWVDILKYFIILLIPAFFIIHYGFPENKTLHGIYQRAFALSMAMQLLLFFLSALEKAIQGFKPAYFYLAAIVYLWYGAIQYVVTILGGDTKELIERQPNDLQIGIVVETIIVFLGIIYRYHLFKKENQLLSISLKNERIKFSEQMLNIQEEERKRIAEDLHDELGSSLAALKMRLQKSSLKHDEMKQILTVVDKASEDTRNISHHLMPPEFERTPLHTLLSDYYLRLNEDSPVHFDFLISGNKNHFSKEEELVIYRIIMELTNNILKHSQAKEATVQMIGYQKSLEIMTEDNGKGIYKNIGEGIGMRNIQSRVNYLNGEMRIDSNPNGTTIIIQIPYKII
jgi:signal transduction histidine kinase